ncbi:hypothetical protein GF373_02285 [bacterium]|nr:hypothetical protein [bacterium]
MLINLFLCLIIVLSLPCLAEEYYIDTQKAFDALCEASFQPGDTILFKKGAQFVGMFAPTGDGTAKNPIQIDTYGKGNRPRIDAQGKRQAGLLLRNVTFWEVRGLEITNTDGTDNDQGNLFGIYVLADGAEKTYEHIYIDHCFIHDVNGKVAGKRRGGIHVHIKDLTASIFHDLRITNNRVVRVGGVGIGNDSSCGAVEFFEKDTKNHYLWTDVYVADNWVDTTGRNNVIARVSQNAIYERNVLANSSRYDTGHSIFCFDTDGIKIQYNEAYGNVGHEGSDRGGFDADYNCVNTFIQYNYSHDNMWFCGIMKRPNRNVVIRYNVSCNDKRGIYFYGFEKSKKARDIHIYNNTHYVGEGLSVQVFPEGRTPLNTRFENNIFYFGGRGEWGENAEGINTTFRNNLYYQISPHKTDDRAITANPMFIRPPAGAAKIDLRTMNALKGFQLKPESPCIHTGIKIEDNGGQDILGVPINGEKPTLGAFAAVQ